MSLITLVGWVGAGLLTACGLPQLYKTWKSKDTSGLSLTMLITWFFGIVLTNIYVIFQAFSWPLVFNYSFNTFVVGAIIYLYLKKNK